MYRNSEIEETGPRRRRARPSGAGRRLARQQARPHRQSRSSPANRAGRHFHPRGVRQEGRHAARRFRPARRHRGAVRYEVNPMDAPQRLQGCHRGRQAADRPVVEPVQQYRRRDHRRFRLRLAAARHRAFAQRNPRSGGAIAGACRPAPRRRSCVRPGTMRCWSSAASTSARRRCCSPMCRTPRKRKRAVAATRYPPQGCAASRSPRAPAAMAACRAISARPMTKSACWCRSRPASAIEQIEAIAQVEGVDGVFIGPSDLAASLGHLGNPQQPRCRRR